MSLELTVSSCVAPLSSSGKLSPVPMLNELEWVAGHVYANVWQSSLIAIIHPASGLVVKWVDLRHLNPVGHNRDAVANGVAFDAQRGVRQDCGEGREHRE